MPQAPFDAFFAKHAAFEAVRPDRTHKGTIPVSVIDEGRAEVYDSETGSTSAISQISLHVRAGDWDAAMDSPPQMGDRFTSPDTGKTYALKQVNRFAADTWAIEAREI